MLHLQCAILFLTGYVLAIPQIITVPTNEVLQQVEKYAGMYEEYQNMQKIIQDWKQTSDVTSRCELCNEVASFVMQYRKRSTDKERMRAIFEFICVNLQGEMDYRSCSSYINARLDVYLYILDNKKDLTSQSICRLFKPEYRCYDPNPSNWTINIPPKAAMPRLETEAPYSGAPLKLLHLSDIHYDPEYLPGSSAKCNEPLCCQRDSTAKENYSEIVAGYWGDYHVCDMPKHAVDNLFDHIKEAHNDIDFVYFTGDIVSHRDWVTNRQSNMDVINYIFEKMRQTFGTKNVFPVLGNHEAHPVDLWSPPSLFNSSLSTKWLLDFAAEQWSTWIPKEAQETVRKGGYYTLLLRDRLRVIVINSNICYTPNVWLLLDDKDPYQQLQWLADTLYAAEQNGEYVHIVTHVPPGAATTYDVCYREYHRIINRFADTISGQFYGHTHVDELKVFYNMSDPKQVINIGYNGASFTTFIGYNPNYKTYEIDEHNFQVLDYDEWIFNLTEANLTPNKPPRWYKLYSFKEAYGMKDLSYDNFDDLLQRMASNITLLQQYNRFYIRDSDSGRKCDENCLLRLLCAITTIDYEVGPTSHCSRLS